MPRPANSIVRSTVSCHTTFASIEAQLHEDWLSGEQEISYVVVRGALRELGLDAKDTDGVWPNPRAAGADGLCTVRPLVAPVDPVGKRLGQTRNPFAQLKRPDRIMGSNTGDKSFFESYLQALHSQRC